MDEPISLSMVEKCKDENDKETLDVSSGTLKISINIQLTQECSWLCTPPKAFIQNCHGSFPSLYTRIYWRPKCFETNQKITSRHGTV